MAHDIDDSGYFTDTWAERMLDNQNIYTYHRYSIDACDLVFGKKQDYSGVLTPLLEIVELVERYFEAEEVGAIEQRLVELFEPYMRKGKDKAHADADEDRDDINDIEDVVVG